MISKVNQDINFITRRTVSVVFLITAIFYQLYPDLKHQPLEYCINWE